MSIARSRLLHRRTLGQFLSGEEGDFGGDWQAAQNAQDNIYEDAYGNALRPVTADTGITSGEQAGQTGLAFIPLNDLTAKPFFAAPILSTMEVGGKAGIQELPPEILNAQNPNKQTVYTPAQQSQVYAAPEVDYSYSEPIANLASDNGIVVTNVSPTPAPAPSPIAPQTQVKITDPLFSRVVNSIPAPTPAPIPAPAPISAPTPAPAPYVPIPFVPENPTMPEIHVPIVDAPVIAKPSSAGGSDSVTVQSNGGDSGQYIPAPGANPQSSQKSIVGPAILAILGALTLFQGN